MYAAMPNYTSDIAKRFVRGSKNSVIIETSFTLSLRATWCEQFVVAKRPECMQNAKTSFACANKCLLFCPGKIIREKEHLFYPFLYAGIWK